MASNDETEEGQRQPPRPPAEGVRIIGAEEAAAALDSGQAAGRRPEDAPRYGDVPPAPAGPRPVHRFPLPDSVDPATAVPRTPPERAPIEGAAERPAGDRRPQPGAEPGSVNVGTGKAPDLPHWTEPATGEVPQILAGEQGETDDLGAWSGLSRGGPRWRGEGHADWQEADYGDAFGGGDLVGVPSREGVADPYGFEEAPAAPDKAALAPAPRPIRTRPRSGHVRPSANGRDVGTAVITGGAIGIGAIILFKLGSATAMFLVTLVVTACAVELFAAFRRAGHRPATLLGLVATFALLVASYEKGETAIPLILAMTVVFSMLWYLFGVVRGRPAVNVAMTVLGVAWVGLLGSFGALLLDPRLVANHNRRGVSELFAAILCTVAFDVAAFFVGSQIGRRAFAAGVSPNKTWEGTAAGIVAAVFMGAVVGGLHFHPWTFSRGLALGVVVGMVAPLGDLCESMIKRDLGLKDMGQILPGHGGVLDRFDAMLFVLPATYYLVRLLKMG